MTFIEADDVAFNGIDGKKERRTQRPGEKGILESAFMNAETGTTKAETQKNL